MAEVHEGICGAHRDGIKMRWQVKRYGYFWLTIEALTNHRFTVCCKAMAFQRMGNGHDWEDLSSFTRKTSVYSSCNKLFHQMGRNSSLLGSDSNTCHLVYQRDYLQIWKSPNYNNG